MVLSKATAITLNLDVIPANNCMDAGAITEGGIQLKLEFSLILSML